MRITSYAKAFPRDRRIYRIDRWTIPIPGGLPLAASAWFLLCATIIIVLGQISPFKQVVEHVGWPAAILVGPGPISIALTRRTTEDRSLPMHLYCAAKWRVTYIRNGWRPRSAEHHIERRLHAACDQTMSGTVNVYGPGRVAIDGILDIARNKWGVLVATHSHELHPARIVTLNADEWIEVRA